MKNLVFSSIYRLSVVALAMTIAVACTNANHSGPAAGAKANTSGPGAPGQDVNGTTDGAGGNGIDGKAYESYIVDPQDLSTYKNKLEAKITAIDKKWKDTTPPSDHDEVTYLPFFQSMWKLKKWYIAPVTLASLDKKTIGVEFTREKTQQLAIQTDTEVWIDSRLFEKMSEDDKAKLMLHEYLMSLYLLKFQSYFDICQFAATIDPTSVKGCDDRATVDSILPPEEKKDLVDSDYTNIRAMTSLIYNQGSSISAAQLSSSFLYQKFDRRAFSLSTGDKETEVKVTNEEVVSALKAAVYSRSLNGLCKTVRSKEKRPCVLDIQDIAATPETYGNQTYLLSLKDPSSHEVIRSAKVSLYGGPLTFGDGASDINKYTSLIFTEPMPKVEGTTYGNVIVILKPVAGYQKIEVAGIVFSKGVLSSVEHIQQEKKDCLDYKGVQVNGQGFADDGILLSNEVKPESYFVQGSKVFTQSSSDCNFKQGN
jgi:hypothetical protein